MKYQDVVSNVNVYGLDESMMGSRSLMKFEAPADADQTNTAGSPGGHDSFLNGIIVQFDLTFSNKAWVQAERYQFLDFVRSQSTIQRITGFDLDQAYNEYVDQRIVEIMKEKVSAYNELQADIASLVQEGKDTQLSDAIVFTVLIIVLLIKPTGLLGKKLSEKV